jgi:hypothetical protein
MEIIRMTSLEFYLRLLHVSAFLAVNQQQLLSSRPTLLQITEPLSLAIVPKTPRPLRPGVHKCRSSPPPSFYEPTPSPS